MANTDPVEVAVEILDKFTDDLQKLEKQLDRIDGRKLNVTLDIDDNGDIEEIKALLKSLEKKLETTLDIDVKGHKKAFALKAGLSKDTTSVHRILTDADGIPMADGGRGGNVWNTLSPTPNNGRQDVTNTVNRLVSQQLKRMSLDGNPDWANFEIGRMGHLFDEDGSIRDLSNPQTDFMRRIRRGTNVATGLGPDVPMGPHPAPNPTTSEAFDKQGRWGRRLNMGRNFGRNLGSRIKKPLRTFQKRASGRKGLGFDKIDQNLGKVLAKMGKFRPTIMKYWAAIALLIPMLVTLMGAALGVVAAFAGIAGAGAAIVGLGLLGYGDSLAESMKRAGLRIQELKKNLFEVLRPATGAFQPILDSLFARVPYLVQKHLVGPLQGLTGFEDLLDLGLEGAISWLGDFVELINELRPQIEEIGTVFGSIFGSLLLELFEWAVRELYNNMEAFMRLGKIIGDLVVIVYNLFSAASFVLAVFAPLFEIAKRISDLFRNEWIITLASMVVWLLMVYKAVAAVRGAYAALIALDMTGWILRAMAGIEKVIVGLYSWATAAATTYGVMARLMALTAIGTVAVLGSIAVGQAAMDSMGPGAPSGAGGGGVGGGGRGTTINIYGDVGPSEYEKLKDNFGPLYSEHSTLSENTSKES